MLIKRTRVAPAQVSPETARRNYVRKVLRACAEVEDPEAPTITKVANALGCRLTVTGLWIRNGRVPGNAAIKLVARYGEEVTGPITKLAGLDE